MQRRSAIRAGLLQSQFPEPPPVTVDLLETMTRQALMLGRKELPLTLIVLDEVQQFIRQDPGLTLKIQTMAERLSSRFDGRLLLVATGQQALSDVDNLRKDGITHLGMQRGMILDPSVYILVST